MEYPQKLKIGERSYNVVYETALKATSSVRIRNKNVVLRLSRFVRGKSRDEIVKKFLNWAGKKLSKISESDFVIPVYKDGGRVCTHNKTYEIRVDTENRKNAGSILRDGVIELFIPECWGDVEKRKIIKLLVEKTIIKDQNLYLKEVVGELNQLFFRESYNICRFKRMNSRFGSCSSKRNINIAYRLLFAPREVFRYVCVHELAHLKEMNHSKKFWALVEDAIPNFKECETWLRNNGFMLG
ncbi:DUF45 domain-containing protein [Candidatus Peregrinibacteria bacterium]|nr:DUF45 domain-containing protein [Candidatus Peregrinibacteria bacterium]